jgi:syndecan 1
MQTILQAAEEEAAEIRGQARSAARAEEERLVATRAALTNLVRQRDAVLADLTRMRGQLEALLSGPTARITVPAQDSATAAAARRDAGAGQPLPGTAAGPVDDAARSAEVGGAPERVEGGTAVLRPPREPRTDARDEATAQPGERTVFAPPAAVERPPGGSPAERTALMSPPDTGAEQPDNDQGAPPPADATVKVGAVGRHEQAESEPDADGRDEGREPTEAEHASASRPG